MPRKLLVSAIIIVLVAGIIYSSYYYYLSQQKITLKISTTTSLYATGLLDKLADEFSKRVPNVILQFIPVGSGAALRLAAQGDVDMVFVHAPNLEKQYIESGVLVNGSIFAYNFFIIVGPPEDPAGINGTSPVDAMVKIYEAGEEGKAEFISRGDNSGTHQRELLLWKMAGLNAFGKPWYIETGTGMSDTLLVANEHGAYTLSDIGTFLKLKSEGRLPYLEILVDQGDLLLNIYSVYLINPQMFPHVKYDLAKEFLEFVISDEGQDIIANYGVNEVGQPLFYPARGKLRELKEKWDWFANQP